LFFRRTTTSLGRRGGSTCRVSLALGRSGRVGRLGVRIAFFDFLSDHLIKESASLGSGAVIFVLRLTRGADAAVDDGGVAAVERNMPEFIRISFFKRQLRRIAHRCKKSNFTHCLQKCH
jgi:hypothetical protein